MPLTLLAITSTVILTLAVSASESRAADTKASSSPPNMVAEAAKAPARNTGKQVAAQAKAPNGDSKAVRRASGPERDDPMLRLLWLLMGSSRRR